MCNRDSSTTVSTKSRTPAARTPASQPPQRKPPSQWESPVFISDSDDDDDIVMKSTWKTRHTKPQPKTSVFTPLRNKVETPPSPLSSAFVFPTHCPKRNLSEPTKFDDSQSSDEDFLPLLERLKRKNKLLGSTGSPRGSFYSHLSGVSFVVFAVLRLIVFAVLALNLRTQKGASCVDAPCEGIYSSGL